MTAPWIAGLFRVFTKVSAQMHVAFRMSCSEMIERGLMIMAQDPGKIFQYGKPAQRIQILFCTPAVQHGIFRAEVPDIIHLSIVRDRRRIGTYFMGIQKPVFHLSPYFRAFPGKSAAKVIDGARRQAQHIP